MDESSLSDQAPAPPPSWARRVFSDDVIVSLGVASVSIGAAIFHIGAGAIVLGLALILIGSRGSVAGG
jgi:hypothetical protein